VEGLPVALARLVPRPVEADEVELREIDRASSGRQGERASWTQGKGPVGGQLPVTRSDGTA
jgi:hypothetical protein